MFETLQMNLHFYIRTIGPVLEGQNCPYDFWRTHFFAHPLTYFFDRITSWRVGCSCRPSLNQRMAAGGLGTLQARTQDFTQGGGEVVRKFFPPEGLVCTSYLSLK